jgi:hypothetical protein
MATNLVYQKAGTAIVFTESGGTLFTPKNVANGAGRVSTQADRGSGSLPMRFKWEAQIKSGSNITIGNVARIYLYAAESAAGSADFVTDAAISVETSFNNFKFVGHVISNATSGGPFYASGVVWLFGRYITAGIWNATGQTFTNVNGDNKITLTPFADDIQAAA